MRADTDVVSHGTGVNGHVLVGRDTGSFERLGGKLLVFVRDHVDGAGVRVSVPLLATNIEDTDLWVWDTSAKAGLWVRLVLAVTVALIWTTTHFDCVGVFYYLL